MGVHRETKQLAALKVFDRPTEATETIENELRLHKAAVHPNIAPIIHFYDQIELIDQNRGVNTLTVLVTEYMENGDLLEFIENAGPLPESIARTFFHQIVNALEYLHSKNIVHRDIKPDNFMLDENYNLRLIDFGFAASTHPKDVFITPAGTISYLSPEIVQNKPYSGKAADIFAAGVILFMMLMGHCPFVKADPNDRYYYPLYQDNLDEFWSIHEEISQKMHEKGSLTAESRNLLSSMLNPKPDNRLSLEEVKNHQWYNGHAFSDQEEFKKNIKELFAK